MNSQFQRRVASAALIIGFFVFWELACLAFGIKDIVLPRPTQIIYTLVARMPAIWPHAIQTLYTTLVGFGLGIVFGVAIGALVGSSRLAYDVAYPLLIGFSSIPKVAVVPILVLWFGAGTVPAIITALTLCLFPIVVNVATGLATTEPELEDVMRAMKASKLDILFNVGLPRTMPYFFASLKVAVTQAFVGTDRRDCRVQPRHRQSDDDRKLKLRCAAGVCRVDHSGGARRRPLCHLFVHRSSRDGMGSPQR